jgi:hypothetical protein
MSLFLAILLVGFALLALGLALLADNSVVRAGLKTFPRSQTAAYVLFGGAAVWFLSRVAVLSEADFGQYRNALFVGFSAVAVLSFFYVKEFLAVRGLAALILLSAGPLLFAGYGVYGIALVYKVAVYLAVTAALWLGAQPWRMRDAISWVFRVPGRARLVGAVFAVAGAAVGATAFAI